MEMKDVLWSDWGNPERILSGLENIGRRQSLLKPHARSCMSDDGLIGTFCHEGDMTQ